MLNWLSMPIEQRWWIAGGLLLLVISIVGIAVQQGGSINFLNAVAHRFSRSAVKKPIMNSLT